MLCCEVSCKVLRTDTVYDQIQEILKRGGAGANFHKQVEKVLLGAIVITRYNNKTYKIDEIAWDKNPMEVINLISQCFNPKLCINLQIFKEFDGRDGTKTSLQKYYAERYNKSIKDPKQPLIISIPKVSLVDYIVLTCY